LDYEEYDDLLNYLSLNFPEIIHKFSIGSTIENRNITAIQISSNEKYKSQKSAMLFTGMHHAREPASMMMNLYLILYLIESYVKNIIIVKEMIESTDIYFIPILNIDGYIMNNKIYNIYGNLEKCMQRKNANRGSKDTICLRETNNGVDLNRNYAFKFNYDQEGASNHPCEEDYRGKSAFSEPETQAVKNFIESERGKKIKIAFNYHSYGNILIMPFNFDNGDSKALALNYTQQYFVYKDFIEEGHFPDHFRYGNGKQTIEYIYL
jgi:murein tripeptide amidase MpaA